MPPVAAPMLGPGPQGYYPSQGQNLDANGYVTTVPTSNITPTMDASLAGTPPLITPSAPGSQNAGDALGVLANKAVTGATNDLAVPAPPATPETGTSILDQIYSLIGKDATKGAVTEELNTEQDIAGKTKAVNDINNQILSTAKAYDDKIKEIEANAGGTFGGAVGQNVANMTRLKNNDMANLYIIKSAANGDLETAQSIVDSKVKAEFEPIEQQIALLSQFYDLNPNLGAKDKLDLEAEQMKINDLQAAYSDALRVAASNGAPASVLSAIDAAVHEEGATEADVYAAAGSYYKNTSTGSSYYSGSYKFSTTQLNSGSAKAGLTMDEFKTLDPDVQNFYVNLSASGNSDLNELMSAVQSGDLSSEDAINEINLKSFTQPVKDYLIEQINSGGSSNQSGGTFWQALMGSGPDFLTYIKNLF